MMDKWTFLAMELENRDETKDKAEFIKRMMLSDRSAIFEQTKLEVMGDAFVCLENGGGEDLTMPDIEEWFTKAKSEVIKKLEIGDVNVATGEGGKE
jgi:hypothetical protein